MTHCQVQHQNDIESIDNKEQHVSIETQHPSPWTVELREVKHPSGAVSRRATNTVTSGMPSPSNFLEENIALEIPIAAFGLLTIEGQPVRHYNVKLTEAQSDATEFAYRSVSIEPR